MRPVTKRLLHGLAAAFGGVLSLGALGSPAEEPKIFECRDSGGNVTYQDDPCPEPAASKPSRPVPAKVPTSAAKRSASAARVPAPGGKGAMRSSEWHVIPPAAPVPAAESLAPKVSGGRFGSPERTWQIFVAAIRDDDPAAAAACLTPSALAGLGAHAGDLPLARLRETVKPLTRFRVDGPVGPLWSAHALRPGKPPKWIFFERTERGEWKIAGI